MGFLQIYHSQLLLIQETGKYNVCLTVSNNCDTLINCDSVYVCVVSNANFNFQEVNFSFILSSGNQ